MFEHWANPPTEPSIGLAVKAALGALKPNEVDSKGADACAGLMLRINKLKSAGYNWISEACRVRQIVDPKIVHIVFEQYGPDRSDSDGYAMHSAIRNVVESALYSIEIRTALIDCYKDASRWAGHCSVVLENTLTDRYCLTAAVDEIYRYYSHIPIAKFVLSHLSRSYIPIDDEEITMYIRRANELARLMTDGLGRFSSSSAQVTEPTYMPSVWFSEATKGGLGSPLLRMAVREKRLKKSKQLGTRWHHNIDEVCEVYQLYAAKIRAALFHAKQCEETDTDAKKL